MRNVMNRKRHWLLLLLLSPFFLSCEDKMDELSARGAVGDICTHLIDINGNICDQELDQRTAAVPLEDIRNKKYRIGVAQGLSKVDCADAV